MRRLASARLFPLAIYSVLAIVFSWPLVLGLGSDVPGDLGDSLLNMWILGWGAEHLPLVLTGQLRWPEFWNANIFHPEPLALALSEHLVGQTLQILPVYWLTGNIILCYNLLFISTFAISAFGTYLLVRDLTGDTRAAFVAGLVYGFLPYRIASVPHLQVISSQWMPFALWGFNRFVTGSPEPGARSPANAALALGTAALVMQNWSCGYYLLYFAPFVPLFVVHRMWTTGTLRTLRTWGGLVAAATGTLVLTVPFLLPYSAAQDRFGFERTFGEIVRFSANTWSYITASENLIVFGKMLRFYPRGEGETFLGFTPWLLAAIAVSGLIWHRSAEKYSSVLSMPLWQRALAASLLLTMITQLIAVLSIFLFGGFDLGPISARTPLRPLVQFLIALALLLGVFPRSRVESIRLLRSPVFFGLAATFLAMWLSLGPIPKAGDSTVSGLGLYNVLYDYVPGFNGVRAPARYAMIAGLFLSVVAGFGTRTLLAHAANRRQQAFIVVALAVLTLAEGAAVPIESNRTWNQNEAMPPARVYPARALGHRRLGEGVPPVYRRIADLPSGTAITEFPFGDGAWEIRYTYYAAAHWKPITNGYSGHFPASYSQRLARFRNPSTDPEAAWRSLIESTSTHAVIHRAAFAKSTDADAIESWLKAHGATELERFPDGDILLSLDN